MQEHEQEKRQEQERQHQERERQEVQAWLEAFAGIKETRRELLDGLDAVESRIKSIAAYKHNARALDRTKAVQRYLKQILIGLDQIVPQLKKHSKYQTNRG